ncbi:MAG: PEP-CTERM sorting domain-containing protein [Nitrospirae bacterium]|nr:PEP-CTERM sorting domain-containing protein [Nitrospirota bacterium]
MILKTTKNMITRLFVITAIMFAMAIVPAAASTLSFDFTYGGYNWGSMTIETVDFDTLSVRYDADLSIPSGSQATGFAFAFNPSSILPASITNPANSDFVWDSDSLTWKKLNNMSSIPNPANSSSITKYDFYYGATEGNQSNITPPGILPGASDIFYLNFGAAGIMAMALQDLSDFVVNVGVRLQGLPEDINEGSLFLVGEREYYHSPEPGTFILLGAGLFGLGLYARKRTRR